MDERWPRAKNILCIRLDSLGDVLMTTPALKALKASPARPTLTLLTSASGAAVAPLVPEIDETMVYDAPWLKATAPRLTPEPEFAMAERLRARNFDAAVIFTVYSQNPLPSAFLAYLARIPLRLAHCHENPYQLLTDWVPDPEPAAGVRHEVERQLALVRAAGFKAPDTRLSLRLRADVRAAVRARLVEGGLDPRRPWIVIHPGATAPSRRYPPESFARAVDLLTRNGACSAVFTGDRSEIPLVEQLRSAVARPGVSLAGQLSLEETAAVIAQAAVLIVNNTGPAHLAAALGTPVVDLYALTNPQHTPWQVESEVLSYDVPCKWCYKSVCPEGHHDCLRKVAPEAVAEAARRLMSRRAQERELNLVNE